MEESYQSQEALILRRAKERNVNTQQLQYFFENKIQEISSKYPDPAYSYLWRLSKVEYLVWERFFPTEPFPGVLEYIPSRNMATLPPKPKDPINMAWTHDRYNPSTQPSSTQDMVFHRASDGHDPEARRLVVRDEIPRMNRQTGDHYSPPPRQPAKPVGSLSVAVKEEGKDSVGHVLIAPQGPNAHQRLTQAEIAARDAQYPRPLPYREQLLAAGEATCNWGHSNAHQGLAQYASASRDAPKAYPVAPAAPALRLESRLIQPQIVGHSSHPRTSSTSIARELMKDRARIRQEHEELSEVYLNQESAMERRAIQGGFRSDMFAYLQKARDNARAGHAHCSRYIRGYISDKKTWEHFWPNEKFPGIEPRSGHTEKCLLHSETIRPVSKPLLNVRPSAPAWGRLSPISPAAIKSPSAALKVKQEPEVTPIKLQAASRASTPAMAQPGDINSMPQNGIVASRTMDRLIGQLSTSQSPRDQWPMQLAGSLLDQSLNRPPKLAL